VEPRDPKSQKIWPGNARFGGPVDAVHMKPGLAIAMILLPGVAVADEATEPAAPKSGWFGIGAGYNPDDDFLASAEVGHADFLHTGQRLVLAATISTFRQDLTLAHEVPALAGTGFDLRSELFARARRYPDFARRSEGGAVTLGRRLDRATRIYARYQVEHVGIALGDGTAARSTTPTGSLGEGFVQTLGGGIAYDTRDSPVVPRHGTLLELSGDRTLGMLRANAALQHARPVGPFTLRFSGRASHVHSTDPGGVPLAFRIQHDGHQDVRGYGLDDGALAGSTTEVLGRAEVELPIWKRAGLSIGGFADAGLAWNRDAAWGPRDATLRRSVGASILWRSPVGPLQFDGAVPLDGDARARPQFLVSLGGAF
jgi:outer membrane protein insertion porin family